MASSATGESSPEARRLTTAKAKKLLWITFFTGLGFLALTFFLGAVSPVPVEDGAGDTLAGSHPVRTASVTGVPTDFLPEQIRLPEFPDPDDLREHAEPPEDEQETVGLSLAALKIDTVALHTTAPVQLALDLPDAPHQLTPGTFSMARFGDGAGKRDRARREGGWGGVGVEGVGIGRVGGGTCGRNPSRPNPIIERRTGFPE